MCICVHLQIAPIRKKNNWSYDSLTETRACVLQRLVTDNKNKNN